MPMSALARQTPEVPENRGAFSMDSASRTGKSNRPCGPGRIGLSACTPSRGRPSNIQPHPPNQHVDNLVLVQQLQEFFEVGGRFTVGIKDLPLLLDVLEAYLGSAREPPLAVVTALVERHDADLRFVEFAVRHLG